MRTATPTRTVTPVRTATIAPTVFLTPAPDDRTLAGSIIARVPLPTGIGNKDFEVIRDGDMPPLGTVNPLRMYDTNDGKNTATEDWIGYAFTSPQTFSRVLFQEGLHSARGGWFETLNVHVRQNGLWSPVAGLNTAPVYPASSKGQSFATYTLSFVPITGDAIRIWGRPGGSDDYISVAELRVFGAPAVVDPIATATPKATSTATPTLTPPPTSTAHGANPTARPTATAAVGPTTAPTPATGLCGNGVRDGGEQCDGHDPTGCPGLCLGDCTCATSFTFPLDGWTKQKGANARAVVTADPAAAGARVLVVESTTDESVGLAYPERATLAIPFPVLSLTHRGGDDSRVQVTVRADDGRAYLLSYTAKGTVPLASKRRAKFPIDVSSDELRTTLRDLSADVRAAFNVGFVSVNQVVLLGSMTVQDLRLAARGVLPADPERAFEIELPMNGWSRKGSGTVVESEYDSDLAETTIRTEPRDLKKPKISVTFPAKDDLAAAYRTFSLAVRDEQRLAIEVRVRVKRGVARLRYEAGLTAPLVKGRKTTLPLVATPIDGSTYRLVTIDLGADLARVVPGASLDGVLGIRVLGKFRMGDVVLRDPLE
jgi:hypothetical protein